MQTFLLAEKDLQSRVSGLFHLYAKYDIVRVNILGVYWYSAENWSYLKYPFSRQAEKAPIDEEGKRPNTKIQCVLPSAKDSDGDRLSQCARIFRFSLQGPFERSPPKTRNCNDMNGGCSHEITTCVSVAGAGRERAKFLKFLRARRG